LCSKLDGDDTCGLTGCGGLSLTAPVDVYITIAVVDGNPNMRPFLTKDECYASTNDRRNGQEGREGVRSTLRDRIPFNLTEIEELLESQSPSENRGAADRSGDERNMGREMETLVIAAVLSGPVTVSRKEHSAKWEKGWVDYVLPLYSRSVSPRRIAALEDRLGAQIPSANPEDLNAWKFHLTPSKAYY
jgi:hypothetical protein